MSQVCRSGAGPVSQEGVGDAGPVSQEPGGGGAGEYLTLEPGKSILMSLEEGEDGGGGGSNEAAVPPPPPERGMGEEGGGGGGGGGGVYSESGVSNDAAVPPPPLSSLSPPPPPPPPPYQHHHHHHHPPLPPPQPQAAAATAAQRAISGNASPLDDNGPTRSSVPHAYAHTPSNNNALGGLPLARSPPRAAAFPRERPLGMCQHNRRRTRCKVCFDVRMCVRMCLRVCVCGSKLKKNVLANLSAWARPGACLLKK